jgi:hypothetical protein
MLCFRNTVQGCWQGTGIRELRKASMGYSGVSNSSWRSSVVGPSHSGISVVRPFVFERFFQRGSIVDGGLFNLREREIKGFPKRAGDFVV